MAKQRPTIQKPTPLAEPVIPAPSAGGDPVMGGVNIPQFTKEMQAEINPEAAPLWNFVLNHAPKIAAGVVSLVVIILAIAGWQWYMEKELAEARGQLGRIISIQDPARRAASLEAFVGSAPSELKNSVRLELAATASELKNWTKAAEYFALVADDEGSSPLGFAARLNQAQALMHKGDFSAASAQLQALAGNAPDTMKPALYQQIGEAAEAAGDKAAAIAAMESALAALPPNDQESAAFFRARIAQLKK